MAKNWTVPGAVAVLLATAAFLGMGPGLGSHSGNALVAVPVPSTAVAAQTTAGSTAAATGFPTAGSLVTDPGSGRSEVVVPAIERTAVLIGDSQASGARGVKGSDTWVQSGLAARGYTVVFLGAGGTGYVARTARAENYPDGVESGHVVLPYGNPALVVVQGGGNDASRGIPDDQILANAGRLLHDLKASYPESKFLFIGTLARGGEAGGRRTQVDSLLAGFAKAHEIPFVSAGDWLSKYGAVHEMADGVHLTAAGHKNLANVLAGKLADLGLEAPAIRAG